VVARTDPLAEPGTGRTAARALPSEGVEKRRSSGDVAADYIRRLIFDGVLRPGDKVNQDDVARTLGISRIPVREALIALERAGAVTIEIPRGAFVSPFDAPAIQDHYDLYGTVYGFAAARALDRGGPDLVPALAELADALDGERDPEEFGRLVVAFHGRVVAAARSPRLKVVLQAMAGLVPGAFFAVVPEAVAIERRGIRAVVEAFASGDAERAAAEYGRTMTAVGEAVVRVFEARGLLA
jgi:DNA-binding GntR family transcriptional regulator